MIRHDETGPFFQSVPILTSLSHFLRKSTISTPSGPEGVDPRPSESGWDIRGAFLDSGLSELQQQSTRGSPSAARTLSTVDIVWGIRYDISHVAVESLTLQFARSDVS